MQIRAYQPGDEKGFQVLDKLLEIHPWNQRNLENWHWKYRGANPAGEALIFVAENNGELVAHFAAIPVRYWIDGREVLASHSIAMMVKPEWQNKGLIKFVADKLIKELESRSIPFTYGYPNDNAHELHIRFLGYEDIAMQPLLERQMRGHGNWEKAHWSPEMSFVPIERFDGRADELWRTARDGYRAAVIRDAPFLNWRYLERPDVRYSAFGAFKGDYLAGYCITKLYREGDIHRGHFMDLFTVSGDSDTAAFLVEKGLEYFRDHGVDEVNLWMQGSAVVQDVLKRYGFAEMSARPLICRFNCDAEIYRPVLKQENWLFTMGDTLEIY